MKVTGRGGNQDRADCLRLAIVTDEEGERDLFNGANVLVGLVGVWTFCFDAIT